MLIEDTVTIGNVASVATFILAGGVLYGRMDARQKAVEKAIEKLTEVSEILARHDVAIEFLTKASDRSAL